MAPVTAASRRPVVDFDETGFSLAPVNLYCRGTAIRVYSNAISSEAELPDLLYRRRFPGRIIIKGYLGGLVCAVAHISINTVDIYVCVSARMHFRACVKSSALDTGIMQPIGASHERRHKTTRRHEFCRVQTRSRSRTKRWKKREELESR